MINSFISLPFCLDPDPDPQIYADPCGSGSETLFLTLGHQDSFAAQHSVQQIGHVRLQG